jgi:hypothetical protein
MDTGIPQGDNSSKDGQYEDVLTHEIFHQATWIVVDIFNMKSTRDKGRSVVVSSRFPCQDRAKRPIKNSCQFSENPSSATRTQAAAGFSLTSKVGLEAYFRSESADVSNRFLTEYFFAVGLQQGCNVRVGRVTLF